MKFLTEFKTTLISIILAIFGKIMAWVGSMSISDLASLAAIFAGFSAGLASLYKIYKMHKSKKDGSD